MIGKPDHHARSARHSGNAIGISPSVLKGQDRRILAQHRRRSCDRRLRMVAFDKIDDEIDGAYSLWLRRSLDADGRRRAVLLLDRKAIAIDGVDRGMRYIDENDVFIGARKIAAEQSPHRAAAAKNCNLHG